MLERMSALLFCLQMCPLDCNDAVELATLIADIQKAFPAQCRPSWLVSYRADTPLTRVHKVESALVSAFAKAVWVTRAKHFANGWPAGSNALWKSTIEDAGHMASSGQTKAEGILTFEADCIPMARDWIDRLDAEYRGRLRDIVGHIHQVETLDVHVNGNAMWPIDLATRWPHVLQVPPIHAWDYFNREFFMPHAQDTALIAQIYRRKVLTFAEWSSIRKHDLRPVLLHGIKDSSGRRLAREQLLHGVPLPVRSQFNRSVAY
jgi:hypothetical protein